MDKPIQVFSEIGKLKTVLLHRPGTEVENLTPDTMERLLFDDIPYIKNIQKEHDYFSKALQDEGIETLFLEELAVEALQDEEVRKEFLGKMLDESINTTFERAALEEYLGAMSAKDMVRTIMQGVRKEEINLPQKSALEMSDNYDDYPFVMDPMPNLYFTRDPFASIGNGVTLNKMRFRARHRESLFGEFIMKHHPRFANKVDIWLDRYTGAYIEGGDELVLNSTTVAIGISQRSSATSIKILAERLFAKNSGFERVLAIKIPNNRAMMHLDTVFTMIDHDKFTVHPAIMNTEGHIDVYDIQKASNEEGMVINFRTDLQNVLAEALNVPEIDLIPTGRGDAIVAPREQWNDGSNTLAIAPGVVVTYDRNYVSNEMLREHGIRVIEVISGELSRGRGGPRCMSQPFFREAVK